jgi:K+-transporting ATPase ATPase C chain
MIRASLVLITMFTLGTGIAYPLVLTGLAQAVAPAQANGSVVSRNGRVVGSALIGQAFTSERYFHPRPSATTPEPYNAAASSGSNLGPSTKALVAAATEAADKSTVKPAPADLVTSSASGLDPDISPAAARAQVARVAAARGLPQAVVADLVAHHIQGRSLGVFGAPRVNVLALNLALDGLQP